MGGLVAWDVALHGTLRMWRGRGADVARDVAQEVAWMLLDVLRTLRELLG